MSEVVIGIFVDYVFLFSLNYLFSDVEELEVADLEFPKWLNSIHICKTRLFNPIALT